MCLFRIILLIGSLLAAGCQQDSEPQPPIAEKMSKKLEEHGNVRVDNYYWLRDRENPEVVNYLKSENDYTEKVMAHTQELQDKLFEEIKGRIKQDDSSVPYKLDSYYYYTRYEDGAEYAVFCRKEGSLDSPEEVLLDGNALAEGTSFFSVRSVVVSSDENILAYATDTQGRRFYNIHFKNLETGETLEDTIEKVTGNLAWALDNKTLFYSRQDPETLRSFQVYRHALGSDPAEDQLVYEENDETFSTYVFRTKSKRFIVIASSQTLSSEYRYLPADDPYGEFQVFLPRERGHEYSIEHFEERFFIRTNWEAQNFRLMSTPVYRTTKEHWKEILPHREDVYLSNFEIFRDYLVVSERREGLIEMRIRPWDGGEEHYVDFGEPAYLAYFSNNPDFDTDLLRYGYMSMTTPRSIYDYDMKSRERTLLKQDEILGGFSPDDYVTEKIYAEAEDDVEIPVSIVYRKGIERDGNNPLLLYGYGSYGNSMDATFSSARLSLLDRGFIYAIGHIRGGQEMGRQWYEDGKLLKKKNTFTDFITCARHLIDEKFTNRNKLFIMGGSAGGLLVGAVVNMAPELFKGAVANVPWVDVVTTMLDPDIPLTTSEYDEWGDPRKKEYYDYMLSYSPYDNVEEKEYPNLLVTTGLHDSQVQYWEPAKWVAKLRAMKTDDNLLLLRTNMDAGHGGASGRFKQYKETALVYAFLLDLAGITE